MPKQPVESKLGHFVRNLRRESALLGEPVPISSSARVRRNPLRTGQVLLFVSSAVFRMNLPLPRQPVESRLDHLIRC